MKIKAPAHSLEMAKLMLEMGADEIYLGLPHPKLTNLTLSGRGRKNCNGLKIQLSGLAELKELVRVVHNEGKKVDYTVNNPFMVSDQAESLLIEQIQWGVEAGVDEIIVADIAVTKLAKKYAPHIKLCASSFFDTYNSAQIDFLCSLGIERIILAYDLLPKDLSLLLKDNRRNVEYEVFGHFGCSLKLGPCLLLHGSGENLKLSLPCRNMYLVKGVNQPQQKPLLDSGRDCSICSLPDLIDYRIDAIKIIGRCKEQGFIAAIVRMYRQAIDSLAAGKPINQIREEIHKIAPWWPETFCKHHRCKYKDDSLAKYCI